ncbi:hypothetical protein WQ53_09855 [Pseudoxanthomonas suwonensis]|uniref:Uncharacterized protein n=2 Tax=Pseudoxanthomonas suwonensis TaxID=314722 RepID=A0A0E3UNJ3_9GAMM|nr:hypothetical protein WQ53_09855 [Pseudoxanthomonas suwonensis]
MPVNRTVNVSVVFNCVQNGANDFGGSATYTQSSSTPSDLGNVVDSNGNIDLRQASAYDPSQYNDSVDFVFTLAPQSTGYVTPVVWASRNGAGATIVVPQGGNAQEFQVEQSSATPQLLTIVDNDDDSNTYNYKPAVELPNFDHYYISLDPRIVNKPSSTNK